MTNVPGSVFDPEIAILTALPKEFAAVKALLAGPISHTETDMQGTRHYTFGNLPSRGGQHAVALTMVGVGNSISASATTQLLNDLPSVGLVALSGIAGGVPSPKKAEDHVRLGDIVVSGEAGIIQYDFVKRELGKDPVPRHPPRPASSNLVRAARQLEADSLMGVTPWDQYIEIVLEKLAWTQPDVESDLLANSLKPTKFVEHPNDPLRTLDRPRVFIGPIASSNTLLKDPIIRDNLRDKYGVKAVEMEGSGTSDAAWMGQAQHFVVRGICDYCDGNKGDEWQNYAAAVAAGYLATVLTTIDTTKKKNR